MKKIKAAIVGPGNIGIDLMEKIRSRAKNVELKMMLGIYEDSEGLARAREYGIATAWQGLELMLDDPEIEIVFEATSAAAHKRNAALYRAAGKRALDLTPAAVGPYVVPVVNFERHRDASNVNMVTCGGQATVPIVAAVNRAISVEYAEIVSTISSRSAGPGTRANIDEFTETTARALVEIGGAKRGKAIILLNPAEPPILMRNTIYCQVAGEPDMAAVASNVEQMVEALKQYVPGYRLIMPPSWDGAKIVTMIEVTGAGDYLPEYAGNLDIITCAATFMADEIAFEMLKARGER
jgi:acetaldehyde dehydrogenase